VKNWELVVIEILTGASFAGLLVWFFVMNSINAGH
jgi:hypothetical protein